MNSFNSLRGKRNGTPVQWLNHKNHYKSELEIPLSNRNPTTDIFMEEKWENHCHIYVIHNY